MKFYTVVATWMILFCCPMNAPATDVSYDYDDQGRITRAIYYSAGFYIDYLYHDNGNLMMTEVSKGHPVSQLSSDFLGNISPQMNNSGDVVWAGHDGNDYEIFFLDRTLGVPVQLTDNNYDDISPQINDGKDVVWSCSNGYQYDIYLYDYSASATRRVTSWTGFDELEPQINSSWPTTVTFLIKSRTGTYTYVYKYLPDYRRFEYVYGSPYLKNQLQLSSNGDIVWAERISYQDNEIVLWDYSTRQRRTLTYNSMHEENPKINNSGDIVWQGGGNIYLYNSLTRATKTITADGTNNNPSLNDNREVVWDTAAYGLAGNIFHYDDTSGAVTRMDDLGLGSNPKINNQSDISWLGEIAGLETYGVHFYSANIDTRELISPHGIDCTDHQFNDRGDVVWLETNEDETKVMQAISLINPQ